MANEIFVDTSGFYALLVKGILSNREKIAITCDCIVEKANMQ